MPMLHGLRLLAVAGAIVACQANAPAQTFPGKPIRFVVPAVAGGGASIIARIIGEHLSASWGQPVIVDNRPGAGGVIGSDIVAKSSPDGHTMMMGFSGSVTIVPALYKKLPYKPVHDFAPVILVASGPLIMLLHPSVPAASLREFIAFARSRPGQINYSSAGNGTASHLATELFKKMAQVDITHVPYKGATPALTDVVGGQVGAHFSALLIALPHVKAGRLRALGVTGAKRISSLPELPTISESGLPGFEVDSWYGVLYPSGVPAQIVSKAREEISRIIRLPDVTQRLLSQGVEPIGSTPAEFAQTIRKDMAKWGKLAAEIGLRLD